jgi:hypothetical protein
MSDCQSTPPADFKVGDKVTYTNKVIRGSRISLSTREGKILELNNVAARVRIGNGRKIVLPLSRLTKEGSPSEVTLAFEALCQAVKMAETKESQP